MDELNKFYKEYGEFIILFEKINSTMSRIIRKVCTAGKLFTEEDNRILILLEGLTAYPILTKFYHIVKSSEIFDDKELFSLIELFYKECQSLIELRNNLAHGTFSIGDPYGNLNNFELSKPKIKKAGYRKNINIIAFEEIQRLNKDVNKLDIFISDLNALLYTNPTPIIKETLIKSMREQISEVKIQLEAINTSIN